MVFKILLISALCVAVISAASCPATVCQTSGGTCQSGTTTYECAAGLFCDTTLTNPVCSPAAGAGKQCVVNAAGSCQEGLSCQNNATFPVFNYVCIQAQVGPGHACTADNQCVFGTDTSHCTAQGVCYGDALGQTCSNSYQQCLPGSFCNLPPGSSSSTCVATLSAGADCSTAAAQFAGCSTGLSCVPTTHTSQSTGYTCMAQFSVPVGSYCRYQTDCVLGSFCFNASTGYPYYAGTCVQGFTSSGKSCNTNSDCNAYETCNCVSGSLSCVAPTVYPSGYSQPFIAYEQCIATGPVACTEGLLVPVGCTQCYDQYCALIRLTGIPKDLCAYSQAEQALLQQCLKNPTTPPTAVPTSPPSPAPTKPPTGAPTPGPTPPPTAAPPTAPPTAVPTGTPPPSASPTNVPTPKPYTVPPTATASPPPTPVPPTGAPTAPPSAPPSAAPTVEPTNTPIPTPSPRPSAKPTANPSGTPVTTGGTTGKTNGTTTAGTPIPTSHGNTTGSGNATTTNKVNAGVTLRASCFVSLFLFAILML